MDVDEHLDQLQRDGVRLADSATDLAAPVPPCPQWTVRDLVTHLGGVHRWATSIVRDGLDHDPAPREEDLATPGDRDVVDWFSDGHAALLSALRAAGPELRCYTFYAAPSPLAFWARRQAHETAIHRADAESAGGAITAFPTDFAADGIAELLTGFAARRRSFSRVDGPRTLGLRPTDAEGWTVTLAPDGVHSTPGSGPAEVIVSGTASDVYLWVWNRPATVVVDGDPDLTELWHHVRVRW